MVNTQQSYEIELVSRGHYHHWVFKVAYVLMTLIIEDDGNGWTEEKITKRFKEVGVGAPEAYAPMDYIAQLEKDGQVVSKIEAFAGNEKDVRRVYRPALFSMFMRIEKA